jgi:hypothetical protein
MKHTFTFNTGGREYEYNKLTKTIYNKSADIEFPVDIFGYGYDFLAGIGIRVDTPLDGNNLSVMVQKWASIEVK